MNTTEDVNLSTVKSFNFQPEKKLEQGSKEICK